MGFAGKNFAYDFGNVFGYLTAYFIFTVLLFFVLVLLKRISGQDILLVVAITFFVAIFGMGLRRYLK